MYIQKLINCLFLVEIIENWTLSETLFSEIFQIFQNTNFKFQPHSSEFGVRVMPLPLKKKKKKKDFLSEVIISKLGIKGV